MFNLLSTVILNMLTETYFVWFESFGKASLSVFYRRSICFLCHLLHSVDGGAGHGCMIIYYYITTTIKRPDWAVCFIADCDGLLKIYLPLCVVVSTTAT